MCITAPMPEVVSDLTPAPMPTITAPDCGDDMGVSFCDCDDR